MGLSGISPMSLLLIFLIVVMFFGSSRLKELGSNLAQAIKSFREGIRDGQSSNRDDSQL